MMKFMPRIMRAPSDSGPVIDPDDPGFLPEGGVTPVTRDEAVLNEDEVRATSRVQAILQGEDIDPATREEYFVKRYAENSGGSSVPLVRMQVNNNTRLPFDMHYIDEQGNSTTSASIQSGRSIFVYFPASLSNSFAQIVAKFQAPQNYTISDYRISSNYGLASFVGDPAYANAGIYVLVNESVPAEQLEIVLEITRE